MGGGVVDLPVPASVDGDGALDGGVGLATTGGVTVAGDGGRGPVGRGGAVRADVLLLAPADDGDGADAGAGDAPAV